MMNIYRSSFILLIIKMVEAVALPLHPSVFPQVLPLHFQMPPATRFTFSCQIPTRPGTVLVLFSNNHSDDRIFTQATERTMYPGGIIHIWSDFCQIPPHWNWPTPSSLPQHGPCRRRSTCSGRAAGSRSAWWSSYTEVTGRDQQRNSAETEIWESFAIQNASNWTFSCGWFLDSQGCRGSVAACWLPKTAMEFEPRRNTSFGRWSQSRRFATQKAAAFLPSASSQSPTELDLLRKKRRRFRHLLPDSQSAALAAGNAVEIAMCGGKATLCGGAKMCKRCAKCRRILLFICKFEGIWRSHLWFPKNQLRQQIHRLSILDSRKMPRKKPVAQKCRKNGGRVIRVITKPSLNECSLPCSRSDCGLKILKVPEIHSPDAFASRLLWRVAGCPPLPSWTSPDSLCRGHG